MEMEGNEYMNGKSRKQISEVSILIIVIDIVDQTVTTERGEHFFTCLQIYE